MVAPIPLPAELVLVVPAHAAGKRLDRVVTELLGALGHSVSRSQVQQWMDAGAVRHRDKPLRAAMRAEADAELSVRPTPPPCSEATVDASVVYETLYVDDDVIVINKPAGLVVHPAAGHPTGTLVNGLLSTGLFRQDLWDEAGAEQHMRPGIVHRLDAGTSGVLVVARHRSAREALKAQFQVHSIERQYLAVVVGSAVGRTHATLHGRHPVDRLRFSSRVREGKTAITHVEVLRAYGKLATLVSCRLETGRTHQIRVHLADSGTPVLGDPLYGKPSQKPEVSSLGAELGHQALHAALLGFRHPTTGESLRFEAPLPDDIRSVLARLTALSG